MSEQDPPAKSPANWFKLHLWQMQPVRDVLLGLGILGLFWLGQKISVVTVPLLLAVLLAYLFEPVIVWSMRKLGISRRVSVGGIIGLAVVFVVIPTVIAVSVGVAQLAWFGTRTAENIRTVSQAQATGTPEGAEQVFNDWKIRHNAESFSPTWQWVYDQINTPEEVASPVRDGLRAAFDWVENNSEEVATTAANVGLETISRVLSWIGAAFGLGFMGFLTVFFFFFMSTEWVKVKGFGSSLLPDKNRDRIIDLLVKFDAVISGFIRGRLTIAFLQAIVFSIAYYAIGVPGAFILGPVVAVLSIVPYLALVGLPISITLLWLEGHTGFRGQLWWVLGAPAMVYFIGQALDDYVWTPIIQGKSTGMDTPTILFASLAGGALFGVFGLLIAIPIAACVKILVQEIFWPRFKEWAEGRADDPLPIED
ncbi:MAG: AI-2E family transporter [Phycisphaerales bacterium]